MITHDARWSLSRGNIPVPSPWLATCKPKTANKAAYDTAAAARLWQISADLVGLTTEP